MDELVELKQRVDSAVEHLAAAQNARRQQQDSLIQLLADLEVKFDARHEELAYCHSRITNLEEANGQLTELLTTVVHLIESGSVEDPNDPIFRASKMAADLVSLCTSKPLTLEGSTGEEPRTSGMLTVEAEVVEDYPSVRKLAGGAPALERPVEGAGPAPAPAADAAVVPNAGWAGAPSSPYADEGIETVEATEYEPAPPDDDGWSHAEPLGGDPLAASGHRGQYDDVSADELEVETLLDGMPEQNAMPPALVQAMTAADGIDSDLDDSDLADRLAEVSSAVEMARRAEPESLSARPAAQAGDPGFDDPGMDTIVDFDVVDLDEITALDADDGPLIAPGGDDADIKALMARIQEAAEKARSRSDAREVASSNRPPSPHDKTGTR